MRLWHPRALLLLVAFFGSFIPGCGCDEDKDSVRDTGDAGVVTPGPLQVGAAEDWLTLPVGTPLGGYTGRCDLFGNGGEVDKRDSDYRVGFNPSAGVQTRIPMKAFWFENGNENLVVLKTNAIYSFDGMVEELEHRLSEATGLNLTGRVVLATNHSHHAYANFSAQATYYLGGDRFNLENFTRMADIAQDVALSAWEGRVPASVGVAHWKDWDPDDLVYHDRRGENNDAQLLDGVPPGSYKDPILWMLRADTLTGDPIAVLYGFGMHGTSLGEDNALISGDAPGATEIAFQDQFDTPVVVSLFQAGGGDASPGGSDDEYARLESVGERAAPKLYELWERISTGTDHVYMETQSTAVAETLDDIHVTRNSTVDWRYYPYDEAREPDLLIYGEDGSILSPIDEFNAQYGAAFCGEENPYLVGFDIGSDVYPYTSCTKVDAFTGIIKNLFELEEDLPLPLIESKKAFITSARLGPFPTILADGSSESTDLLWSFFPGETTSVYVETYRRRVQEELGLSSVAVTGYAQDHEGYLLTTEDWLLGGYEPAINVWGPLQGDHILDAMMTLDQNLLTNEIEPQGTRGERLDYGHFDMPAHAVDMTPDAGTLLKAPPAYLYSPLYSEEEREKGVLPELSAAGEIPRVQGMVQVAWMGGDPGVDLPTVILERNDSGTWTEVTTRSGRAVSDAWHDILVAHTPDPLQPSEAEQTHYWYAAWQSVGHLADRAGLALGEYRLHIYGKRATDPGTSWPYETTDYELTTESWTLVPAELALSLSGSDLYVSIPGPARGFRHIAEGGYRQGDNPVQEHLVEVTWFFGDGSSETESLKGTYDGTSRSLFAGAVPKGATGVEAADVFGNLGALRW